MADSNTSLPRLKQTILGLYATAKETYERWQAEPEKTTQAAFSMAGR